MLSIDLGIGLTSIAVAVRQATNYATTWSFAAYAQANGGALPGPWADVRRTGTATYENASGVITTLPDLGGGTYAARVQYSGGTARGMLNEGQATNLLKYSEDFSNAAWTRLGTTEVVNSISAPDGASTADKLTDTSAATTARFTYQTLTKAAAAITYTLSAFVKAAEYGVVNLFLGNGVQYYGKSINISDGTITTIAGSGTFTFVSATRVALGNGWYRVSLTCTSDTNTSLLGFVGQTPTAGGYTYAGTAGSGIYVWGAQLEAGSAATSYVPTGAGTVVRAADSAGVFLTSTALSAAFPGGVTAPWTTVFQYRKGYSVSSDETLFALSAGSSAGSTNLLALQTNGTQAQSVHSGGSGTLSGTLVHDGATVNKVAVSVDPSAVGPELVTNGGFASSSGWNLPGVGTNAISGGVASLSGASGYLYRTGTAITSGKWYRVSFTVSGYSAGTVRPYIQASPVFGSNVSANGSHVQYLLATATSANTEIGFNVSGFSGSVDDLSITEVTAKMSISVNGAAAVETTGIAFTGAGVTHLIPGARTTGGSTPVAAMEIYDWRNVNTAYTTGASLQALSA